MKGLTFRVIFMATALGLGFASYVQAESAGKPLMSGMVPENGLPVQHVRDALSAYASVHKNWPAGLDELADFSLKNGLPIDLKAFAKIKYYRQDSEGTSVAVFEFEMAGKPPVKGAFAMSNFIVK